MAQPFDVCIRGGGVVGRTLALLLARQSLRVGLVAPTGQTPAGADVRAYALNAASRALLESLRCWPDAPHATPVLAMDVWGDDGGAVRFDALEQGVDALAWIADVPALEHGLTQAIRYQPQIDVLEAPAAATLTVVCEGKASATRAELGVTFEVTPYAQRAIAARLTCEKPHAQTARQWFSQGNILALLPLDGADGNSVALVWSVEETRAEALMALDAAAFGEAVGQASQHTPGPLHLSSERSAWPLQLAQVDRWVGSAGGKAWALAGDAAHTVHPLAGQGLNLGLADAAELAQVLQQRDYWRSVADMRLLRRYERSRKAAAAALGLATDGLQQLFAAGEGPLQKLRNWGMSGFANSGPLKSWVARQAMGLR